MLGKENTIRLSMLITLGIVFRHGYFTRTCVLLIFHLLNLLKPTEDQDHIRESVGKKVNAYALTITALAGYWLLACPNETDESIK